MFSTFLRVQDIEYLYIDLNILLAFGVVPNLVGGQINFCTAKVYEIRSVHPQSEMLFRSTRRHAHDVSKGILNSLYPRCSHQHFRRCAYSL